MKARFNKVKNRYVNKFSFDNNTTLGIGNVQPLFCKQIAGGSKVSVNFGQLTRLSPLVVPTFARLKQRNDFCFVPMSMVMPSFDAFLSQSAITGTAKSYTPQSVPCITNQALFLSLFADDQLCKATANDGAYSKGVISVLRCSYFDVSSIKKTNFLEGVSELPTLETLPLSYFDFLFSKSDAIGNESWSASFCICCKLTQAGRFWYTVLRGLGYTLDFNDTHPVSILPLWAFAKAYYDIYYPKRDNPWHVSNFYAQINKFYNGVFDEKVVGGLTIDFVSDFNVLKPLFGEHGFDFYASVDDSLATVATLSPINKGSAASNYNTFDNSNQGDTPFVINESPLLESDSTHVPSLIAHNGDGTSITADQLSLVNKLWNFVQKSSVVGQSVKDWFAVHLGQKTNEDMFDQTLLVQSIVNDVSINPVISTAQTSNGENGDNLGALAGQGYAAKNGKVSFEARTFGYFMCLTSLVPISGVGCGTQPELYCNTIYEQQLPDFDGVGYEVLNKTSFNESIVDSNKNVNPASLIQGGFGYVPRLSSWKSMHNIRSGNFALNSVKDSFLPYCVDVLPTHKLSASILWRFPWANAQDFVSFNRIFYNQETEFVFPEFTVGEPLDDNFMSQSVFDFSYTSYLKPLSDSYSVESLGKDLVSVKEQ